VFGLVAANGRCIVVGSGPDDTVTLDLLDTILAQL
jgi:hypothetical protein